MSTKLCWDYSSEEEIVLQICIRDIMVYVEIYSLTNLTHYRNKYDPIRLETESFYNDLDHSCIYYMFFEISILSTMARGTNKRINNRFSTLKAPCSANCNFYYRVQQNKNGSGVSISITHITTLHPNSLLIIPLEEDDDIDTPTLDGLFRPEHQRRTHAWLELLIGALKPFSIV